MARRNTKAEAILGLSQTRIDKAQMEYDAAVDVVGRCAAKLEAYKDMHRDLAASLAPKPRGRSTPAPTVEKKSSRKRAQPELVPNTEANTASASSASKKPSEQSENLCGICGNNEDFQDHFKPSPNFHEFEGKKAASAA